MKRQAWNGSWHPLAERFPMLTEEELREMAASIAERGQYVPCRMSPEGLGLDGRNRVAACALAEVDPWWEVYEGDPVAFIVEVNSERRHLTTGQRAMATAIGLVESGKREPGKRFKPGSVPDANGRSSIHAWAKAVGRAGVVLDHAPELADPVLCGDLALDAAYTQADERRKDTERIAELGGDLAALVKTGVIDVDEAVRRADEERRLATLEDDLAERVRSGNLALDEAEAVARQRHERVTAWIEDTDKALALLVPMAGGPLPARFKAELPVDKYAALTAALQAWKRQKGRKT